MQMVDAIAAAARRESGAALDDVLAVLRRATEFAAPVLDTAESDLDSGFMVLRFHALDGKDCRAAIRATFDVRPRVRVTGSNKGNRRESLAHVLPGALVAEYNGNATRFETLPPNLPPELF